MNRMTHRLRSRAFALAAVALLVVSAEAAETAPSLLGVVTINTASAEELELLPGIGETRARAVVTLRERRGGFRSIDELKEVKGIGDAGLERIRPFVRLDGETSARKR